MTGRILKKRSPYFLMSDAAWEAKKAAMRARSIQGVESGEYVHAQRTSHPQVVVASDPLSCQTYCPECGGAGYRVVGGEAVECSRLRARVDALKGGEK